MAHWRKNEPRTRSFAFVDFVSSCLCMHLDCHTYPGARWISKPWWRTMDALAPSTMPTRTFGILDEIIFCWDTWEEQIAIFKAYRQKAKSTASRPRPISIACSRAGFRRTFGSRCTKLRSHWARSDFSALSCFPFSPYRTLTDSHWTLSERHYKSS